MIREAVGTSLPKSAFPESRTDSSVYSRNGKEVYRGWPHRPPVFMASKLRFAAPVTAFCHDLSQIDILGWGGVNSAPNDASRIPRQGVFQAGARNT